MTSRSQKAVAAKAEIQRPTADRQCDVAHITAGPPLLVSPHGYQQLRSENHLPLRGDHSRKGNHDEEARFDHCRRRRACGCGERAGGGTWPAPAWWRRRCRCHCRGCDCCGGGGQLRLRPLRLRGARLFWLRRAGLCRPALLLLIRRSWRPADGSEQRRSGPLVFSPEFSGSPAALAAAPVRPLYRRSCPTSAVSSLISFPPLIPTARCARTCWRGFVTISSIKVCTG